MSGPAVKVGPDDPLEVHMIYVLYATNVNIGGWATFTRHLLDSLQMEGHEAVLVKLGNRDEAYMRPFGGTHYYQNMTLETLLIEAANNPVIIAALGKHYVEQAEALIKMGAKVVIHDTAESTVRMGIENPWCIRKTLAKQFEGVFIRHPYVPSTAPTPAKRGKRILATSRVDFDKNTIMILEANRLGAKIDIVGFENRLYTKFKIMPNYPEWNQSPGTHPRTGETTTVLLKGALAMVDLTDIKGDGGGTQYTFLEAWDAGAIPIIGTWWLRKGDDMEDTVNCFAVKDAFSLNQLVKRLRKGSFGDVPLAGQRRLTRLHAPKIIVPQVMDWLDA
jgi:hypothetical protein